MHSRGNPSHLLYRKCNNLSVLCLFKTVHFSNCDVASGEAMDWVTLTLLKARGSRCEFRMRLEGMLGVLALIPRNIAITPF